MCGIFGITSYNPELVKTIINKCSHRGPDGSDLFACDKVTLGHNLLAITSNPSDGKQPWISEKGNVLIYNGELFNYKNLLNRFRSKFFQKTTCDTELLSWLLDEFEYEEVISNIIDSMHSIAFYNKIKNELVLSRDHVGIKPLFFSLNKSGIIFSSEIKGLLDHVQNSNKIDRLALSCTSLLGVNVLRQTVFNNIYKVLPGETIIYNIDEKKIKKTFRTYVKPFSDKKFNSEEFISKTSETISNSSLGLRKFGVFLSGGIDSSVVAYELKKNIQNLETFTNVMEPNAIIKGEDHNSDFNVAKKFARDNNFKHNKVSITPEIILENWDSSINCIEEPRYNWNLPMYYYTNKFLSNKKIVVTMSGDIGDEIFGGYQRYLNFKNLVNKPKTWRDFIKLWSKKFAAPIELNIKFDHNDLVDILCKELPNELWNPEDLANSAMALDCVTTVSEDFFSRNDRFGMAFSMEGRFPLASKNYMQYCLSLSSQDKLGINSSETKIPIKSSYNKILPNYILTKYKTGWSVPITHWLQTSEKLQKKYLDTINTSDGISEILTKTNYEKNIKKIIITWMFRTWSQQYNMNV